MKCFKSETYLKNIAKELSDRLYLLTDTPRKFEVKLLNNQEQELYFALLYGAFLGANWEMGETGDCQRSADTAEFIFMRAFHSENRVGEPSSMENMYNIIKKVISEKEYKVIDHQLAEVNNE